MVEAKEKLVAPGELRRRRNEWLLDLKLELIRVLRDNGSCISFGPGTGKKTWMKFPAIPGTALMLSAGEVLLVDLISKANGEGEKLNPRPGKDMSVFNPAAKVSIESLLEFTEQYPTNPFL